jgi:hypothetical protein
MRVNQRNQIAQTASTPGRRVIMLHRISQNRMPFHIVKLGQ